MKERNHGVDKAKNKGRNTCCVEVNQQRGVTISWFPYVIVLKLNKVQPYDELKRKMRVLHCPHSLHVQDLNGNTYGIFLQNAETVGLVCPLEGMFLF